MLHRTVIPGLAHPVAYPLQPLPHLRRYLTLYRVQVVLPLAPVVTTQLIPIRFCLRRITLVIAALPRRPPVLRARPRLVSVGFARHVGDVHTHRAAVRVPLHLRVVYSVLPAVGPVRVEGEPSAVAYEVGAPLPPKLLPLPLQCPPLARPVVPLHPQIVLRHLPSRVTVQPGSGTSAALPKPVTVVVVAQFLAVPSIVVLPVRERPLEYLLRGLPAPVIRRLRLLPVAVRVTC